MEVRTAIAWMMLLALTIQCEGQPILYVDPQVAAACTNYDPISRSCATGTNLAFPAIPAAAAVATAGSTVLIRGGTYFGQLIPGHSGTPGNYVTYKNYGSELVYLTYPGTHYVAIDISGCRYIIIDGLHVEDTNTYWFEGDNCSDNIVQNCVFKHSPATGTRGNVEFVQSDHNLVLNNDIEDGQDDLTFIDSNSNLLQGNIIREARHSIFGIRCGNFNILRSNYFSNTEQKIGEVYDCGVDTHAVSNVFNATKHNIIEDNIFALTCAFYATAGCDGIQYGGQQGIIRRNVFYHCNTGLGMQVYGDESLFNTGNRIYNNVFYTNNGPGLATWPGATNNIFVNNILFGNQGCLNDCTQITPGQVVYRAPLDGSLFETNDLLFQTPGQAVVELEFGAGYSLSQFNAANPGIFIGTIEANPQFVNGPGLNFQLKASSPMIDTGAFLTGAASAGTGTNLPVVDATYFSDGFGIAGVPGDTIQLQGQIQTANVVAVDYVNNILTLDQPLAWVSGQGVSLQYGGQGPDLGAFEMLMPTLNISLAAGQLQLSWPLGFSNYFVESTSALLPSTNDWKPNTNAVAVGNQWVVSVPVSNETTFFRLTQ